MGGGRGESRIEGMRYGEREKDIEIKIKNEKGKRTETGEMEIHKMRESEEWEA